MSGRYDLCESVLRRLLPQKSLTHTPSGASLHAGVVDDRQPVVEDEAADHGVEVAGESDARREGGDRGVGSQHLRLARDDFTAAAPASLFGDRCPGVKSRRRAVHMTELDSFLLKR